MPNYFAPAFRIRVDGNYLAADISKNIQQVSVTSEPNTMDSFSFTLVNEYPKMRWTHTNDAYLFQQGAVITIYMGYVDDLQEMIEGEITQLSPSFPENGTPVLNISGNNLMHWLHGSKTTRTFTQMTDKQIVEKVATEAQLQPQVDETDTQFDYVIQNNQTDLEFLRERAARIHFEMLVKGKTLIFRKSNEGATKIYTFVWGHTQAAFAAGPDSLPLKSFTPSMNVLKPPSSVEVRGYDQKNKTQFVANAQAGDEPAKMDGTQTGSQVVATLKKPRQRVQVNIPVASQAEADQHAKALLESLGLEFISGSASTIGVPDIRCGSVVELQGLGAAFSGTYYIDKATHTIGASGYSTDLTVKRNSTNGSKSH